jgi:hypothetical protein
MAAMPQSDLMRNGRAEHYKAFSCVTRRIGMGTKSLVGIDFGPHIDGCVPDARLISLVD